LGGISRTFAKTVAFTDSIPAAKTFQKEVSGEPFIYHLRDKGLSLEPAPLSEACQLKTCRCPYRPSRPLPLPNPRLHDYRASRYPTGIADPRLRHGSGALGEVVIHFMSGSA
ncbi:hypothetical protein C7212DRAFT_222504, partial [Tuber magnatum]